MAKRASAAKKSGQKSDVQELNPGVSAASLWNVYRATSQPLAVNADYLEVTDGGALLFFVGQGTNMPPHIVIAADQYIYCSKIR